MPDAGGNFRGISVPRIPWLERYPDDCIHEEVNASKACEICFPKESKYHKWSDIKAKRSIRAVLDRLEEAGVIVTEDFDADQ